MAEALKVLGQSNPSVTTLTTVYTVPTGANAVISTITVANRSATPTSFRVSVSPAGVADSLEHYIYYDIAIAANESFAATIGITVEEDDEIRVYATLATLSFNVFGTELS